MVIVANEGVLEDESITNCVMYRSAVIQRVV